MKKDITSFFFKDLLTILPETFPWSRYQERVSLRETRFLMQENCFVKVYSITQASIRLKINSLNITVEAYTTTFMEKEFLVHVSLSIRNVVDWCLLGTNNVAIVRGEDVHEIFQTLINGIYQNEEAWNKRLENGKKDIEKIRTLKKIIKNEDGLSLTNSSQNLEFSISDMELAEIEKLINYYHEIKNGRA